MIAPTHLMDQIRGGYLHRQGYDGHRNHSPVKILQGFDLYVWVPSRR